MRDINLQPNDNNKVMFQDTLRYPYPTDRLDEGGFSGRLVANNCDARQIYF